MIQKDNVTAWINRLHDLRKHDQFDYDELELQLSELPNDKRAKEAFDFIEGLLELADKIEEFLTSFKTRL